jgi:hypothetical protein
MHRLAPVLSLVLLALGSGCGEREQADPSPTTEVPVTESAATYAVEIAATPERPRPGEEVRITLRVAAPSRALPRSEADGNTAIHLVAVSRDLAWYEHVHPQLDRETYHVARLKFPRAGQYVLHAIVLPTDGPELVQKQDLIVGTKAGTATRPLTISPRERRTGRYTVRLRTDPEPPAIGDWSSLIFDISRDGEPVTDLTPTGTLGHMVILREGGEDFVYAHSTDGEAVKGVRARAHLPALPGSLDTHRRHTGDTGPEVTFHTRFPRVGKYKVWVELLAGGDAIKADFVVDVGEPKPPEPHAD